MQEHVPTETYSPLVKCHVSGNSPNMAELMSSEGVGVSPGGAERPGKRKGKERQVEVSLSLKDRTDQICQHRERDCQRCQEVMMKTCLHLRVSASSLICFGLLQCPKYNQ
ncbi:hypothetical protein INR49_014651, partial [Caranx melampygus]